MASVKVGCGQGFSRIHVERAAAHLAELRDREPDEDEPDEEGGEGSSVAPTETDAAEIIVDAAAKEALPLVADEPRLGPLVREQFAVEEEQGNLVVTDTATLKRMHKLERRWAALEDAIKVCRAETIGGVAWRLHQLLHILEDVDDDDSEVTLSWVISTLRLALEDAKALAQP